MTQLLGECLDKLAQGADAVAGFGQRKVLLSEPGLEVGVALPQGLGFGQHMAVVQQVRHSQGRVITDRRHRWWCRLPTLDKISMDFGD